MATSVFAALAAAILLFCEQLGMPIAADVAPAVPRYAKMLRVAASAHDADPFVAAALVHSESKFDAKAVGAAGETGLMQLHPKWQWGKDAAASCRLEPARCTTWWSIWHGVRALAYYRERCGSYSAAIVAYKSGGCRGNAALRKRAHEIVSHAFAMRWVATGLASAQSMSAVLSAGELRPGDVL